MIRAYQLSDKPAVLKLFDLNTPKYFDPSERDDFIKYLDQHAGNYFVSTINEKIVGCGGINYMENKPVARIAWDMIHPDFHGKGIGSKLAQFRVEKIKANPSIRQIVVRTSQLAFTFYEKQGFKTEKTVKDYWAEGFDLYLMSMHI